MTFNFPDQLNIGNAGEADFQRYYHSLHPLKSKVDLTYDFTLPNGFKAELKTDTYSTHSSDCFFLEYQCGDKLGGPWRAAKDGIPLFCYYFKRHHCFFWFATDALCEVADKYLTQHTPRPIYVSNGHYGSTGYLIPRSTFKHIILRKDTFK